MHCFCADSLPPKKHKINKPEKGISKLENQEKGSESQKEN